MSKTPNRETRAVNRQRRNDGIHAGPVGEALIMTAIGLMVAVPAVLCYNYLVRRNKVITEKLRAFAGDLQAYLISRSK